MLQYFYHKEIMLFLLFLMIKIDKIKIELFNIRIDIEKCVQNIKNSNL